MATLVHLLILPPAGLFLLLALGLLAGRRHAGAGKFLVSVAIGLLFLFSTGIGARMLVYPLERLVRPLVADADHGAQAIVVLAAGRVAAAPEYGGVDIPDYVALARLRYAAHLYRRTGLPILVSGGNGSGDGRVAPKAPAMAAALRGDFGVPVRWVEPDSATTAENAFDSAALLRRSGVTKVLLVTDAMHMARAAIAFSAAGVDTIAAPTMFFSAGRPGRGDLLPTAEHLRQSCYAVYEWFGLAWYALRYPAMRAALFGSGRALP